MESIAGELMINNGYAGVAGSPRVRACPALLVLVLALVAPMLLGCSTAEPADVPPDGVYAHPPAAEDSRARPVPPDGPIAKLTRGLIESGAFCVRPRSNADGTMVWCRTVDHDDDGRLRAQVVNLMVDRDGELAWAWFPPPEHHESLTSTEEVTAAARAPLAAAWPGAEDRVEEKLQQIQDRLRGRAEAAKSVADQRTVWRDRHARYHYAPVSGLVVDSRTASVPRWPYGGQHYATTMSSAVDDLTAGGYDCHYPPQRSCTRVQSNGYFRVALHDDQIMAARFGIGTLIEDGRQRHPISEEFPHGLTFLSPTVRDEVTARIERSRRNGESFAGVVAGTVVIIDASLGQWTEQDRSGYFDIQIGVPLIGSVPG